MGLFYNYVLGKECTNTPTELSSHSLRHQLLNKNNKTLKEQVLLSHNHLTPTDESAWANLLPRKVLKEEDDCCWMMMYRKMKNQGAKSQVSNNFLNEVFLGDVRLDPDSIHGQAQQTNLEYLLMFDVDSLAWNFRKTAGLPTPGVTYGGWEAPDQELRGHFVGHYLSATALMWASTGHKALKKKMTQLVSAIGDCQEKMSTGYLSAFPTEFFDRFEASRPVWAPYYTIHKVKIHHFYRFYMSFIKFYIILSCNCQIMAGLVDQYVFAGNNQSLKMVIKMADYFCKRVQNVITQFTIERHWQSLNEESGGMNDVMYRLYTITGDAKHLLLANLFDKPCFLGPLAIKEIGMFFMDAINSSHMYATGGTSVNEFWNDPRRLATTLETENEESCTTYNMLKVSRILFRWTKEMAYADYYERALTNGVLSIQRGKEPGIMLYMLPLGPGMSKAAGFHKWGTPFDSFWCCYGTGIESFSKLGDSIYFKEVGEDPGLYIIQYISSSVNWKYGQIFLDQKVMHVMSCDPHLRVTATISSMKEGLSSSLKFRIPFWTTLDAKATLNGQIIHSASPGNFLSLTKKWSFSDVVTLELPITLRLEPIQDDRSNYASLHAILFGPYLLVGLSTGDSDLKPPSGSLSDWIIPIPSDSNSQLISLSQESEKSTLALAHINKTITMINFPGPGTSDSVFSTFRIISTDYKTRVSSFNNAIGKTIMLEPYNHPGMVVVQQKKDHGLGISDSFDQQNAEFRLLDGNEGMVRLESVSQKGCFVHCLDRAVKLMCDSGELDSGFVTATSFKANNGISNYHAISFVAKGLNMNYLLQPLFSLRDEQYTVYFKIFS
ncbi:hypothetical protein R6Q57_003750 [Mikania cordata]